MAAFEGAPAGALPGHRTGPRRRGRHANRAEQVASELAAAIDARRRREQQGNDEFEAWNRKMQVALYKGREPRCGSRGRGSIRTASRS